MNLLVHIVDDDDAVRDSLALLLAICGYQVDQFPSGKAFLKAPDHDQSHCIILDIELGDENGLDVLSTLRI